MLNMSSHLQHIQQHIQSLDLRDDILKKHIIENQFIIIIQKSIINIAGYSVISEKIISKDMWYRREILECKFVEYQEKALVIYQEMIEKYTDVLNNFNDRVYLKMKYDIQFVTKEFMVVNGNEAEV